MKDTNYVLFIQMASKVLLNINKKIYYKVVYVNNQVSILTIFIEYELFLFTVNLIINQIFYVIKEDFD